MENRLYLNELFDCYNELFTNKERQYFTDYYKEDLSLSEISENYNVSRSAVQKALKTVSDKLNNYEEKLSILKNKNKILDLLEKKEYEKIKEIL